MIVRCVSRLKCLVQTRIDSENDLSNIYYSVRLETLDEFDRNYRDLKI